MMIFGQRKTVDEKNLSAKDQFGIHYFPTSKVLPKKMFGQDMAQIQEGVDSKVNLDLNLRSYIYIYIYIYINVYVV